MGYSIPGADYTLPPMQINIGAEVGKSFSAALIRLGEIRRQERKEAKELLATQNAFKNQLLIQQNELKTGFFSTLNEAGVTADGNQSELFNQFQVIVNDKAKSALDARVQMQFDQDISDEERQKLAKQVADFNVYSKSSLEQIGGLLADADSMHENNMIVVGDPSNGEQLSYQIALTNIANSDPKTFDKDAIINRQLTEQNGDNLITSIVKIPANSQYFKTTVRESSGTAATVLQKGLDQSIIKEEMIGGRKFLVFKNVINASNYSKKGGMDLVVQRLDKLKTDEVFKQFNFVDDNGSFTPEYVDQDSIIVVEDQLDVDKKPTGNQETVYYNIVDMNSMASNQNFLKDIEATYKAVFNNPKISRAQQENYLLQIGISRGIADFDNVSADQKKQQITAAMVEDLFSEKIASVRNGKVDQIPYLLKADDNTSEMLIDEADSKGLINPITQKAYKANDVIYVQRVLKEITKPKEKDSSEYKPGERQLILLKAYKDPTNMGEILLTGQADSAALSYDPNSNTWQITKVINGVRVASGPIIKTEEEAKEVLKRAIASQVE